MTKVSKRLMRICGIYVRVFLCTFIVISAGGIIGFGYSFFTQKSVVFPFHMLEIKAESSSAGSKGAELFYSNELWMFLVLFPILVTMVVLGVEWVIKRGVSCKKHQEK